MSIGPALANDALERVINLRVVTVVAVNCGRPRVQRRVVGRRPSRDENARAFLSEGARHTSAHSFCRAGHDRDFILNAHDAMI